MGKHFGMFFVEYVDKPRKWKFVARIDNVIEVVLYVRKPKRWYQRPAECEGPQPPMIETYMFFGKVAGG